MPKEFFSQNNWVSLLNQAEIFDGFVVGGGSISLRKNLFGTALQQGLVSTQPLVHPSGSISETARLGDGVSVGRLSSIASNTTVGANVLLNRGVHVGHDVSIGQHSVLGPGAVVTGFVRIGDGCFVGAGAVILPGLTLGDGAIVGAGAIVTKKVRPGATVVGNPARESNAD